MISRITFLICCLITTYSRSQGYSGDFAVPDKQTVYHFTLVEGSLPGAVYTIAEGTKYIHTMYLADSVLLTGVDSSMVVSKKDSLLRQFLQHFSGVIAEYNAKGRMVVAKQCTEQINLTEPVDSSMENQRISFYPNGKPYAQFYLEKGQPARSIIYFTRDGETDQITDLSKYPPGEEVLIRNPWDFKMRRKKVKVVVQ